MIKRILFSLFVFTFITLEYSAMATSPRQFFRDPKMLFQIKNIIFGRSSDEFETRRGFLPGPAPNVACSGQRRGFSYFTDGRGRCDTDFPVPIFSVPHYFIPVVVILYSDFLTSLLPCKNNAVKLVLVIL